MKKHCLGLTLAVATLTACGGAPSESDIRSALDRAILEQQKMMGSIGGAQMASLAKIEYTSVKKLGCKEDGENAYRCDVEVVAKTQMGEGKEVSSVRFIKSSDGWVAGR